MDIKEKKLTKERGKKTNWINDLAQPSHKRMSQLVKVIDNV